MTRPQDDPARRCLKLEEWPSLDHALWRRMLTPGDLLDEALSPAASWRPATRHKNRRGYGRWLHFLCGRGAVHEVPHPADRVTKENVRTYMAELIAQAVTPYTLRNRICELLAVMLAMAPNRDWGWLRRLAIGLDQAALRTEAPTPTLMSNEVVAAVLHALKAPDQQPGTSPRALAQRYRDLLMLGFVAAVPLRRSNLAMIAIDTHLRRTGATWRLTFDPDETKTGERYEIRLPSFLVPVIHSYMAQHRPVLLGRVADHRRLWVSKTGRPMSEQAAYHRITRVSQHVLGVRITPHVFRSMAATTVSILDPEHIGIVPSVLQHASPRTSEDHYIRAGTLNASRRLQKTITAVRRRLAVPAGFRAMRAARHREAP